MNYQGDRAPPSAAAERVRPKLAKVVEKQDRAADYDLTRFRASLEIDEDDLDRALAEQPRLFYEVAEALTIAVSRQRGIAMQLKDLKARLHLVIRDTAARRNEKTREDNIKNRNILASVIKKLDLEYLDASAHVKEVRAMKEAYQQRSYALKDMVSIELERLYQLGVERGAVSARNRMAVRRLAEQRTKQRRGRASE